MKANREIGKAADAKLRRRAGALGCATGLALLLAALPASANPQGRAIQAGSATFSSPPGTPSTLEITQTTDKVIIKWNSFNISPGEVTRFIQPGPNAIALNRVQDSAKHLRSEINGTLQANGNVWIVNPNGVVIGPGAQVDVHGFLASTADIRDIDDFMNGKFDFSIPSPNAGAAVINKGSITFGEKGLAALVAPHASNEGVIVGHLGQVVIAGVPTFSLDLHGDGLIRFGTSPNAPPTSGDHLIAENKGDNARISVDGGYVLLTADAAEQVIDRVINAQGIIEAKSVASANGEIVLNGGADGTVNIAGKLDAAGGEMSVNGRDIATQGTGSVEAGALTLASTASGTGGAASLKGNVDRLEIGSTPGSAPFDRAEVRNAKGLTIDGIDAKSAFVTADGTLKLDKPVIASGSGDSIVLQGAQFVNDAGAAALQPKNGRFLIYSTDPAADAPGGLQGTLVFNGTLTTKPPATIIEPGNVFVYSAPPPPPPTPPPPEIVLTPQQLVQATLVGPVYEVSQAGTVAAVTTAVPPKTSLFAPPQEQKTGEGEVMFSNDGNHSLWGLSAGAGPAL